MLRKKASSALVAESAVRAVGPGRVLEFTAHLARKHVITGDLLAKFSIDQPRKIHELTPAT